MQVSKSTMGKTRTYQKRSDTGRLLGSSGCKHRRRTCGRIQIKGEGFTINSVIKTTLSLKLHSC
jgi:hypothetical protein